MLERFATEKHSVDNFFPSYEQIMNLKHRVQELVQPTGGRIFTCFGNEITIENLSYAYPGHKDLNG